LRGKGEGDVKAFLDGPLRVMLAVISLFGMWRSLIAITAAIQDEASPWRTALVYLFLLLCLFFGAYFIFHKETPGTGDSEGDIPAQKRKNFKYRELFGTLLIAVALSLFPNGWLGPYLRPEPPPASPTTTPTVPATSVGNASPTPSPQATTIPSPSPTSKPVPTASIRPTRIPDGVRMEIIVARVHVRQSPTSQSASRGELNNGDWLFFDARAFDTEGTLWLRIGRDQLEDRFKALSGYWVFAGGVGEIGLQELPLLPPTATPSG
jgi:hypothetical protein